MKRPKVLAIASHPIQYQAPWFRALARVDEIDFSVLFIQQPDPQQQGAGFGVPFEWDVPLLEGYRWQQVPDIRGRGGLRGFFAARVVRPVHVLRQIAPDAVVMTGWHAWPMIQMLIAARRSRVPLIMRGDSRAMPPRPWLTRALHRLLLKRCTAFLPVGAANLDFYRSYGVPARKLFSAPHFVDNERFAQSAQALAPLRAELREQWGIAQDAVCYCYVGKLEPKKRILDLLDALRIACAQAPQLHLLVVGSGELMGAAKDFVERHRLPVTFAGFVNQSEIPRAYVAADCLVLPSDWGETWGLVVNEAMACGRPALVSDRVGCAADLVAPGVTGEMFQFGDTHALAQKLVEMARDPQRLRAMGEQARARVMRNYGVQQAVDGTLAAVRYVLARE